MHVIVKRCKIDEDGKSIGTANNNPILDTRLYEVEFIDGTIESITANAIAENLLAQVDAEGQRQLMIDEIIDHRSDATAIQKKDGYVINKRNNTKNRKLTTRG
jgi:hypothetical protein